MRGDERVQDGMFSYVSLEQRVPADHPMHRWNLKGYAVGLIARTKSQLDETAELIRAQGGKAVVTPTDVSRRDQVVAAVETVERELGPISVLINNAGAYLRKRFTEITKRISTSQLKVNAYRPSSARRP